MNNHFPGIYSAVPRIFRERGAEKKGADCYRIMIIKKKYYL